MKRRVIQRRVGVLLLLLVGGAIVNVAVAWTIIARSPYLIAPIKDEGEWPVAIPADWPRSPEYRWKNTSIGFLEIGAYASCQTGERYQSWSVQTGWPMKALLVEHHKLAEMNPANTFYDLDWAVTSHFGIEFPKFLPLQGRFREFPTLPLWPGFALNTIFYAAMLWVVFFVPGKLKRTLRRRRGLCPACAYPVGTSPVCTECGYTHESYNPRRFPMRNEILLFVMLLCAVSCRGTPETVADPPAYSEDRSQLDRFLAEDFATLGHGFWIAYPLDPLPNGEFKLTFYDPTTPNSARSKSSPIQGNSAQLMLKMDADMERYTAVRVIRGIAFDQWPSVAQLENALRTQGWTEVTGRPGLWRRPK